MDPKENYKLFRERNKKGGMGDSAINAGSYAFNYTYYIELRLSNVLSLLSNPSLCQTLGIPKQELINEAHRLTSLSRMIEIPPVVSENGRNL